jgi:hypothetical protein
MIRIPSWKTIVAAIFLSMGATTLAFAQPPEKAKTPASQPDRRATTPNGFGGGGMWGLVQNEAIQKELKLRPEQIKRIEDIRAEFQGLGIGQRGPKDSSDEDRRAKAQTMQEKVQGLQERVKQLLDPPQLKRLEEISLQVRLRMQGIVALDDARIVEQLGITDLQREQLRKLQREFREKHETEHPRLDAQAWRALSEEQQQAKRLEHHKLLEKLQEQATLEAMKIFSDQQKNKLEQLKGKTFAFDMEKMMPSMRERRQNNGKSGRPPAEQK